MLTLIWNHGVSVWITWGINGLPLRKTTYGQNLNQFEEPFSRSTKQKGKKYFWSLIIEPDLSSAKRTSIGTSKLIGQGKYEFKLRSDGSGSHFQRAIFHFPQNYILTANFWTQAKRRLKETHSAS